jgi:hypothetical protein
MKARILPAEEWVKFEDPKLPPLFSAMLPKEVSVIVVEDEEKIIARMLVMRITHLEGVWIDPEYKNAGVTGALLRQTAAVVNSHGDVWAMAGSADSVMTDILERMGGVQISADFFALGIGG